MKDKIKNKLEEYTQGKISKETLSDDLLAMFSQAIDFAYFTGIFNVAGIDATSKELARLNSLGFIPHDFVLFNNKANNHFVNIDIEKLKEIKLAREAYELSIEPDVVPRDVEECLQQYSGISCSDMEHKIMMMIDEIL